MKKIMLIITVLFCINSASADMIFRSSFTKDANDSIGSLKGILNGTAAIADGKLNLDGKGWVEYPGGIVTKLDCATTEVWFTYRTNTNWVRVFDFGNTNSQGNGAYVWYFTPRSGRGSRTTFSNTDPGSKYEEIIDNGRLPQDVPIHVVVIFDSKNSKSRLYINGKLIGERKMTVKLSDIGTQHLYLGKSSYNADRPLQGTIDEFRIYNGPLSDLQVLLDSQIGPDNLQECVLTSVKPANDANNIPTNASLNWAMNRGIIAIDHFEVAFGTDVNSILPTAKTNPSFTSIKQGAYTPSGLKAGTVYYWRVDLIAADKKRFIGPVSKFTTAQ